MAAKTPHSPTVSASQPPAVNAQRSAATTAATAATEARVWFYVMNG